MIEGKIKGVIFDVGGVLASDVSEYLFEHDGGAVAQWYNLESKLTKSIGNELWRKYAFTNTDESHKWQELEQQYWDEFKAISGLETENQNLIRITRMAGVRPVDGMPELLKWIKQKGLDLMICSNNTEFFYQHQQDIGQFGEFFDPNKIALSCRFGVSKGNKDAALFKSLEPHMVADKSQYLFVDDRANNITAGLRFGVRPIYFPAEDPSGAQYVQKLIETMI